MFEVLLHNIIFFDLFLNPTNDVIHDRPDQTFRRATNLCLMVLLIKMFAQVRSLLNLPIHVNLFILIFRREKG
jgi:hypothetical protein